MRHWPILGGLTAGVVGVALLLACKRSPPPSPAPAPIGEDEEDSTSAESAGAEPNDEEAEAPHPARPRSLDAVLAELDARDLAEQDPERLSAAERARGAGAPRAGGAPSSDWALLAREGGCAELSSLGGIPQLREAPDPYRFAALFRSQGVEATATAVPGSNGEAVEVHVPTEGIGMLFLRRSRCPTIISR